MKKVIIKFELDIPYSERAVLEAKFRKQYEEGLLIVPHYCCVTVIDDNEIPLFGGCEDGSNRD
jgi:hypothetical protein